MKRVLAVILGDGAGTRLQPLTLTLTLTRAKPAVPLGGKYRLIDIPISNCINSGIYKIHALTQFNSQSLNRHISRTYNLSSGFDGGFVEVLAAQQTPDSPSWFQSTADAVRQYRELFAAWDVDQVLILSGDQLYRMDDAGFVAAHWASGAALTVATLPVDPQDAQGFGLMRTDPAGRIQEFRGKPSGGHPWHRWASMCSNAMSCSSTGQPPGSYGFRPGDHPCSIGRWPAAEELSL